MRFMNIEVNASELWCILDLENAVTSHDSQAGETVRTTALLTQPSS